MNKTLLIITSVILLLTGCSKNNLTPGEIKGTVFEYETEQTIEDVKLQLMKTEVISVVFSDEFGEYKFEEVPEGDYYIYAIKEGYNATCIASVNVIEGTITEKNITLYPLE